jgi:hypothetical protein
MKEPLIFGMTWQDIQARQQGTYVAPTVNPCSRLPLASQSDIDLLRDKGIDYIEGNGLFGVIDRLKNSAIIPATK